MEIIEVFFDKDDLIVYKEGYIYTWIDGVEDLSLEMYHRYFDAYKDHDTASRLAQGDLNQMKQGKNYDYLIEITLKHKDKWTQ